MRNFVQTGDNITVAAPSGGVASGDGVLVSNLFGIAFTTAVAGTDVVLATHGVYELPKLGTAVLAQGARVSWDATGGHCDAPGTGHFPIGVAIEAAGNGTTRVKVRLDGVGTVAAT